MGICWLAIVIMIVIIILKHLMVLIGRDWATRSLAVGNYWRTASSGSAVKQKACKYNIANITNTNTKSYIFVIITVLVACPYSPLLRGGGDVDTEELLAREVRAVKILGGGAAICTNTDIGESFFNFQQIA